MLRFRTFISEDLQENAMSGLPYFAMNPRRVVEAAKSFEPFVNPVNAFGDVEDQRDYINKIQDRLTKVTDPRKRANLESELSSAQSDMDKRLIAIAGSSLAMQGASTLLGPKGAFVGKVAGSVLDAYASIEDLKNAWIDVKQTGRAAKKAAEGLTSYMRSKDGQVTPEMVAAIPALKTAGTEALEAGIRGGAGILGAVTVAVPGVRAGIGMAKGAALAKIAKSKATTLATKAAKASDAAQLATRQSVRRAIEAGEALDNARTMPYPDLATRSTTIDNLTRASDDAIKASEEMAKKSASAGKVADRTATAAEKLPTAGKTALTIGNKELSLAAKAAAAGKTLRLGGKGLATGAKLAGVGLAAAGAGVVSGLVDAALEGKGKGMGGGGGEGGGTPQFVSGLSPLGSNVGRLTGR